MKRTGIILIAALMPQMLLACVGSSQAAVDHNRMLQVMASEKKAGNSGVFSSEEHEKMIYMLDEIAELERAGVFLKGMGFRESGLRQMTGDYPGTAVAIFKELSWAYGHGFIDKTEFFRHVHQMITYDGPGKNVIAATAVAITAFMLGNWDKAEEFLIKINNDDYEPDNYINWMILSCALEKNPNNRKASLAYRSMRARNSQFPEYWYRGAKLFPEKIALQYAEYCINLSSDGVYAAECREIIAVNLGLKPEDGALIKTKVEVEIIIDQAIKQKNPRILEPIISLIGLPENPYTIYVLGAMKPLATQPLFKEYFEELFAKSNGQLAERLNYICRG